jgi:hypothetical protein
MIPITNNNVQGTPYIDWEIRDFTEGLIDINDSNLIPVNAAQDCQNVISRVVGKLKIRNGQLKLNSSAIASKPIQGLYPYYKENGGKALIAACNGSVYYWNTSGETPIFTIIEDNMSATNNIMFESCANYMVCFDGTSAPFKWDMVGEASILANAPEEGKNPVLHKEQLFVQHTSYPSQLWWSDIYAPEIWPATNYWSFNDGDGDSITCHKPFLGELIVFKRRSIHNLRGTTIDDFRSDMLNNRVGCVGQRAAVVYGNAMYFVADDGLYQFNGVSASNITQRRIPNFWARINKANIHKAVAEVWDGLLWIALPEGASTVNNVVLIYDLSGGKFWVYRGINASCFAIYNDGSSEKLYSGSSLSDGFIQQQDTGTDDNGAAIEAWFIGQEHNQGTPDREKGAKKVFLETEKDYDIESDVVTTANTYKVTPATAITSYTNGLEVHFRAGKANTGAATLTCSSLSAIPILRNGVALVAGDIKYLDLVHVVYQNGSFLIQEPMTLSISLDGSPVFRNMELQRTDGISHFYKFPSTLNSKAWKCLTPKFYRNALGPCEIRGLLIPVKTKIKPKVRKPKP